MAGRNHRNLTLLVVLLLILSSVSSGIALATSDQNVITEISSTNEVNHDNRDDLPSNFDIKITADTRLPGYDKYINPFDSAGDPEFTVIIEGDLDKSLEGTKTGAKSLTFTDIERKQGAFVLPVPKSTLRKFDRDSVDVTVKLYDSDGFVGREFAGGRSATLDYEPPGEDKTATESIVGLLSMYRASHLRRLNASYWRTAQVDALIDSSKEIVPTSSKDIALDLLAEYGKAQTAASVLAVPKVSMGVSQSIQSGKYSQTVGADATRPGTPYYRLHRKLSRLIANTNQLRGTTGSERRELLQERKQLLKSVYKQLLQYESGVKKASQKEAEDTDYFGDKLYGPDSDAFNVVLGDIKQLKQTLRADYVYTQYALNPGGETRDLANSVGVFQPDYPSPDIVGFSVPEQSGVGESVIVKLRVRNDGSLSTYQTMSMSFPDATSASNIEIVNPGLPSPEYASVFSKGDSLTGKYGYEKITADHPMAEVASAWLSGQTHTLKVEVTPAERGEFRIRAKSVAKGIGWKADPAVRSASASDRVVQDQQFESAYEKSIQVGSSSSVSLSTEPSDARVYIDGEHRGTTPFETTLPDDGDYTIRVEKDGYQSHTFTASAPIEKHIRLQRENSVPTAEAGIDKSVAAKGEVLLDGFRSSDPDGDSLSYAWQVISGPGRLQDAQTQRPTYVAPDVDETRTATIQLSVSDSQGNSDSDTVQVTISPYNTPPSAIIGSVPTSITAGDSIRFDGSDSSDPDGSIASYEWDIGGDGQIDRTGDSVSHTFASQGSYEIRLRVTDDDGATDTATITIQVEANDEDDGNDGGDGEEGDSTISGGAVNLASKGASAKAPQGTWRGAPSKMIDADRSTQWQVDGNPDTIEAIFILPEKATVTGDQIVIGTGGNRDISEYKLYSRSSSTESWTIEETISGSVTEDSNGWENHSFDPITGKEFKIVITQHTPPDLCYSACDVPIREYHLFGESTSGGEVTSTWVDTFNDGTFKDKWHEVELPERGAADRDGPWSVTDDGVNGNKSLHVVSHGDLDDNAIATNERVLNLSRDFTLSLDWQTPDPSNRGVFLRLLNTKESNLESEPMAGITPDKSGIGFGFGADAISKEGSPFKGKMGFSGESFSRKSYAANTPHSITVEKQGDTGVLYVDGERLRESTVNATGSYYLMLGTSGTWGSESSMSFDNVTIEYTS